MGDWDSDWANSGPAATNGVSSNETTSYSRSDPRGPRKCYNCQSTDHMSRDCPEGPKERAPRNCYNCQSADHMSRDCPEGPKERTPRNCYKCNQPGHMARDCTSGSGDGPAEWTTGESDGPPKSNYEGFKPREPANCRKCHQPGHSVDECTETNWLDESGNPRPPPSDHRPAALTEDQLDDHFFNLTVIKPGENFDAHLQELVSATGFESESVKPPPMLSFTEKITSETILKAIQKSGYKVPTLIQQHAIPVILDGRDVMACAQTGSGKTLAFLAPILQKIFADSASPNVSNGYGQDCQKPLALVITPTRELADQIHTEAFKFTAGSILKTCCIYGGTSTNYLLNALNKGCHLLVATIGRLHDFASKGKISFTNLKYFILDEADRMIDDGFMPEVRRLITRPDFPAPGDRQTIMFSATFSDDVQREAREVLASNYIFISVGKVGGVNTDVSHQIFEVEGADKKARLTEVIDSGAAGDRIMVFVQTKKTADYLATFLSKPERKATSIHGDRYQAQREEALRDFKSGKMPILVATSVAARGLDIKNVSLVINYDLPDCIDDYVHRTGRTGRVGNVGKAISFFDPQRDSGLAEDLARALRDSNQEVPEFLLHSAGKADIAALDADDSFMGPSSDVRLTHNDLPAASLGQSSGDSVQAIAPSAEASSEGGWA